MDPLWAGECIVFVKNYTDNLFTTPSELLNPENLVNLLRSVWFWALDVIENQDVDTLNTSPKVSIDPPQWERTIKSEAHMSESSF